MDVAASEFFDEKERIYDLAFKDKEADGSQRLDSDKLQELYQSFIKDYPMCSIEDPFEQDDWKAWAKITAAVGKDTQIVGDDLLVTNPTRVQKAIEEKVPFAARLWLLSRDGTCFVPFACAFVRPATRCCSR